MFETTSVALLITFIKTEKTACGNQYKKYHNGKKASKLNFAKPFWKNHYLLAR